MSSRPKIAVITGASRGLGRSSARHLARAGVGVIGTYRSRQDEADALVEEVAAAGVPAAALQLDVGDSTSFAAFSDSVADTLRGFGVERFDHLVQNAGDGTYAPYTGTTEDQLDEMVRVHLKAPFLLTQTLLPLMVDGGRILNISSGATHITLPGFSAYAAAKGALEVLTRYQAAELGTRGIRVNSLAPGAIATDFAGGRVRDDEELNRRFAESIALGRVGEPDDIGAGVAAVLSDGFGWATGTSIELSGGQAL